MIDLQKLNNNIDFLKLKPQIRYLYISLVLMTDDDNLVYTDDKHIKGMLYPYTPVNVKQMLKELYESGFATPTNRDGKQYIELFSTVQMNLVPPTTHCRTPYDSKFVPPTTKVLHPPTTIVATPTKKSYTKESYILDSSLNSNINNNILDKDSLVQDFENGFVPPTTQKIDLKTKIAELENNENVMKVYNVFVAYRLNVDQHSELPKNPSRQYMQWLADIDRLIRIDKKPIDEILKIIEFAKNDQFWQVNFLAITKLRRKNPEGITYYKVLESRMKGGNFGKNRQNNIEFSNDNGNDDQYSFKPGETIGDAETG